MPGTFSPPPTSKESASYRSRHASRHVRHAVMHVGIAKPWWWGKRSRHSRRMCIPRVYVSGKRSTVVNLRKIFPHHIGTSWTFQYFWDFAQPLRILYVLYEVSSGQMRYTLEWHHNDRDGVSNHRRLHCLLNCWFWCRSKNTSKQRVTGLCEGKSSGTGARKRPVTREMLPFDYVIMTYCVVYAIRRFIWTHGIYCGLIAFREMCVWDQFQRATYQKQKKAKNNEKLYRRLHDAFSL